MSPGDLLNLVRWAISSRKNSLRLRMNLGSGYGDQTVWALWICIQDMCFLLCLQLSGISCTRRHLFGCTKWNAQCRFFLIDSCSSGPFGIAKACSIGNKLDVDECDLLEFLLNDNQTKVIGMYLESIKKMGRDF